MASDNSDSFTNDAETDAFNNQEDFNGLWRHGDVLVVSRDAAFPDICIKTNQPTHERFQVQLTWFSGWLYLLILIHLLLFMIVVLIVRKKAVVLFGMSEEAQAVRRRGILNGISALMAGFGCFFLMQAHPAFLLVGLIFFIGGLFYVDRHRSVISANRIDEDFVHIKGACPEFLNRLPDLATRY